MDFNFKSCYAIPMRYFVLLFLLTGCKDNTSSFNRTYPKRPEIVAAMNNLSSIIPKCQFDRSANVVFDNDVGDKLNDAVLGHCIYTEVTKIHDVILNRLRYDQFKSINYYTEMLIVHELGHCQFGLDHVQGTIMDPYANYLNYSDSYKIKLMKQFEQSYCGQ